MRSFFIVIFYVLLSLQKAFGQTSDSTLQEGTYLKDNTILPITKYKIIQRRGEFLFQMEDSTIALDKVAMVVKNNRKLVNLNNKDLDKEILDGAIQFFGKYFRLGDTGQLQKLNYTNLYYAIASDTAAVKVLKKNQKSINTYSQIMVLSYLSIANGISAITTENEMNNSSFFNERIRNLSALRFGYIAATAITFTPSVPLFFISPLLYLDAKSRTKKLKAIQVFNDNVLHQKN